MNLPKKCGDIYIKFDDKNNPEYGFQVDERFRKKYVRQFIVMTDKKIDTIILPNLVDAEKAIPAKHISQKDWLDTFYLLFKNYASGEVELCEKCFKSVKNARIILPYFGSTMIDYGCFGEDAKIEFVTNKDLTLKQVYRTFDTGVDYAHENWTLIADKSFNFDDKIGGDEFCVRDYDEALVEYRVANLKLTHGNCITQNAAERTL